MIGLLFRQEIEGVSHWLVDELEQLSIAINKAIDELTEQIDAIDSGTAGDIDASQIISGLVALDRGGTAADLSATGPGILQQASLGAAITVGTLGVSTIAPGNNGELMKTVSGAAAWSQLDYDFVSTAVGAQNNWAPGFAGASFVVWNGASTIAVTGFSGGPTGRITFKNVSAAQVATFAHASGSSSVGNKLSNFYTAGVTTLNPGDSATWLYDTTSTTWKMIECSTIDTSRIITGQLALARGGTNADLSATGGSGQYVKQAGVGSALTVGVIAAGDLPTGIDATKIADGSIDNTEFQAIGGLVSNAQQQINNCLPHPLRTNSAWIQPIGTTAQGTGCPNGSLSGAFAEAYSSTFAGVSQTTAASLNATVGITGPTRITRPQWDPTLYIKMKTGGSIGNIRIWMGLCQDSVMPNADTNNTVTYACFRYSTAAGDGGWVGVMQNASAAQTVTATVASIAINTDYLLRIRFSGQGTTAYFSVNGGTEVSSSSNVPAPGSGVQALRSEHRVYTLDGNAKTWLWSVSYIETPQIPLYVAHDPF